MKHPICLGCIGSPYFIDIVNRDLVCTGSKLNPTAESIQLPDWPNEYTPTEGHGDFWICGFVGVFVLSLWWLDFIVSNMKIAMIR